MGDPLHFKIQFSLGMLSYGILLVNLCLKVAFPVLVFLKTF